MKSNRYRDADAAPSKALCIVYYENGNDKQALDAFLDNYVFRHRRQQTNADIGVRDKT